MLSQNSNTSGIEDDEDPVVEEIPLYLSSNLQDNLYVFQYPIKSYLSSYEHATVLEAKVKPLHKEVELSVALDTESTHYDSARGKNFAQGLTSTSDLKTKKGVKRPLLDRSLLKSHHTVDNEHKYMAGIFADGEIHLTPIHSILKLRPSFDYIDQMDKRAKETVKGGGKATEDDEELQAVTVKFSNTTANKKLRKKQDYSALLKASESESWLDATYYTHNSPEAELERQHLFCTSQDVSSTLIPDSNQYLNKLLPRDKTVVKIDQLLPPLVQTKVMVRGLGLVDQLKHILKEGKLQRFDDIVQFVHANLDNKVTAEKIVRQLSQVGVLIHGNWCAQSEILYPTGTFSVSGISAEHMIRARNSILNSFLRTQSVSRRQMADLTGLPAEEVRSILQTVARLNNNSKWELLLPPNRDFEQRYPEQVMRHKITWNAQIFKESETPRRVRKRSARDSFSKTSPAVACLETTVSSTGNTTSTFPIAAVSTEAVTTTTSVTSAT